MIQSQILGIDNGAILLITFYGLACLTWLVIRSFKK
jgi:hypothetical protein